MTPKQRYRRRKIITIVVLLLMTGGCLIFAKEIRGLKDRDWGASGVAITALVTIMLVGCIWVVGAGAMLIRRHRRAITRAAQLAAEERYDEAIEVLKSGLSNRTMDAMLYLQMSYIETARNRHDAALDAIDAAEKAAGPTDWIEAGRSTALWNANRPQEAVDVCRKAVSRWPESLNAHLCLSRVLIGLDQIDAARAALTQTRQLIAETPFEKQAHQAEWTRMVDAMDAELSAQATATQST